MKAAISSFHVGIAAEAVAAAQFARCGFNVSIQYGANQPEYDLVVAEHDRMLKVSVKGSQDGGWGLTQGFLKKASEKSASKKPNYHGAAKLWLDKHHPKTAMCFVQFRGARLEELPRLYLATPREVFEVMNACSNGAGTTILYESHTWTSRAKASGTTERIPDSWRFTRERIEFLLTEA